MAKEERTPRFGPGHWVTLRENGEHVRVEAWSSIGAAYRVRSRKRGVWLVGVADLEEVIEHPDLHLGKHWSRCPAAGCGAPLTPGLPVCPRCQAPTCTCGRCACVRAVHAAPRPKAIRKKVAAAAR